MKITLNSGEFLLATKVYFNGTSIDAWLDGEVIRIPFNTIDFIEENH